MSKVALFKKQPDQESVDQLKLLLREAEAGRMTGFVLVGECEGNSMCSSAGQYDRMKMVGRLEMLKTRLCCELLNEASDLE